MKHSNLVEVLRKAGCVVALLSGSVFATDYTWLANPESGDWLTGVNWLVGGAETAWTAGSGNTATFGASATKDVDVDGSVAVSTLTVNDDYSFTNGTLTVEGNFSVAAGKTATVESALQQTSSSTRFAKTGSGTLVVNGDASHTNSFYRFAAP